MRIEVADRLLVCPGLPNLVPDRQNVNNGRAGYTFNPHPAVSLMPANYVPSGETWSSNVVLRWSKFAEVPKARALLIDIISPAGETAHVTGAGADAGWNLGFGDGRVQFVSSKDVYGRLKTHPANATGGAGWKPFCLWPGNHCRSVSWPN
jgi:hypothetical protein